MRLTTRPAPRYDPKLIYAIQVNRAAGLTAAEIADKHNLPVATIVDLLRSPPESCALLAPYDFQQGTLPPKASEHIYWLGYIAASGRVFGQNARGTLVLAIHPEDGPHIQRLLGDLIAGHVTCEFVDSSLHGREVYIRDSGLARALLHWGIGSTLQESGILVEFIPQSLIPDFFRGYLEGSRHTRPFGGLQGRIPSPQSLRSLALVGSARLIEGLTLALRAACGVSGGMVGPSRYRGLAQVVYSARDARRLLESAYRLPTRSAPRAEKYVAWFARR